MKWKIVSLKRKIMFPCKHYNGISNTFVLSILTFLNYYEHITKKTPQIAKKKITDNFATAQKKITGSIKPLLRTNTEFDINSFIYKK